MEENIGIVFGVIIMIIAIVVLAIVVIIIDRKTRVLGGEAEPYTIPAIRKYNGNGFRFYQGDGE